MTGAGYGTRARTLLFVPGTRPDRFAKAAGSGADAMILDLEDAVSPQDKLTARSFVAEYVCSKPALVRVNAADTAWHDDDLLALRDAPCLAGVVLPKTETAEQVASVAAILGERVAVLALLETARGVQEAGAIARLPQIARLLFGSIDFGLDMGIAQRTVNQQSLLYARSAIVLASRAAGLAGPVDGVQADLDDDTATLAEARQAASLGFSGKLCLHPRQVPVVRAGFTESGSNLAWAVRVVAVAGASAGAAMRVDGEMIDKPRLELARRMIDSARREEASTEPGRGVEADVR